MKITAVEVIAVEIPLQTATSAGPNVYGVVARLQTDEGLEGVGHAIPYSANRFMSLVAATKQISELLIGEDPTRPEKVYQKMNPATGWMGTGNVPTTGTTALDIAVWDLAAKAANLPLYKLLGGFRDRIPVYASLRLGRGLPDGPLPEIAEKLVEEGFTAVKSQVGGRPNVQDDVRRIGSIRAAIGPDIKLLVDVNSLWTPAEAIRGGRLLEEFNLFWLEDPTPIHNLPAHAEVCRSVNIPIATGETLQGFVEFRPLFEARAVDIPMPDVIHVGGITPFRKIAHLAEAFGLPLANHLLPAISSQLIAASPNGLIVEYIDWETRLFQTYPLLDHGDLVMLETPGHGLTLDEAFLKQHRIG